MNKLIFLFGPTASGKTALIENIFNKGYQLINADSIQVYKHFDIASAKPTLEQQKQIKHHLVDVAEPWDQFTVGDFVRLADKAVEEIYSLGDIPVIAGGTAYYFKHFLYGMNESPSIDLAIREKVEQMEKEIGKSELFKLLVSVDPISGSRIAENDLYRVKRALEVYYQTGKPLSSFAVSDKVRNDMKPLILFLNRDKESLYKRIEQRVDIMFKEGALCEMQKLFKMNADSTWPAMQAIGYKEFLLSRDSGELSVSLIKQEIIKNSKKYAKRQNTFFKSFSNYISVDPEDIDTIKNIVNEYLNS